MPGTRSPRTTGLRPRDDQRRADGRVARLPAFLRGARRHAPSGEAQRRGSEGTASDRRGGATRLPARRSRAPNPALLIAIALGLLSLPTLTGLPLAPLSGCARWIALAAGLELLSLMGFAMVFKLVFCPRLTWRRGLSAALRGLGASTVLPAGGLVGPAIGAYSTRSTSPSLARVARSAVAFVVLTNAPSVAMLAAVGVAIRVGLLSGPRSMALTLLPAGLALTVLAGGCLIGVRPGARSATPSRSPRRLVRA